MLAMAATLLLSVTVGITNPNLKYLMFYTCVTPQIGNQCEEVSNSLRQKRGGRETTLLTFICTTSLAVVGVYA